MLFPTKSNHIYMATQNTQQCQQKMRNSTQNDRSQQIDEWLQESETEKNMRWYKFPKNDGNVECKIIITLGLCPIPRKLMLDRKLVGCYLFKFWIKVCFYFGTTPRSASQAVAELSFWFMRTAITSTRKITGSTWKRRAPSTHSGQHLPWTTLNS